MCKIEMNLAALLIALTTTSCAATYQATYIPTTGEPTATLHIVAKRDAAGFLPTGYVFGFSQGLNCGADGPRASLGGKYKTKTVEDFNSLPIPAGNSINLTALTIRALNNATRQCGDMINFTPIAGHAYEAIFSSSNEAQHCALAVRDLTVQMSVGEIVPSCHMLTRQDGTPVKNGEGLTQLGPKIEVHVTRY